MIIHIVSAGENIYSIAQEYDVSAELLQRQNQLPDDGALVVGQALVVYNDAQIHVVSPGDTLDSIARQYGISVKQLYRNNYFLLGQNELAPGEELVISLPDEKRGVLGVNGYAYPFIEPLLLDQELPYMTYLTPFTYGFTPDGDLLQLPDVALLDSARRYGVSPWLHLSTLSQSGGFDSGLAVQILEDPVAQDRLIEQLAQTISEKGYTGLDVDFEFLPGSYATAYADFIARLRQRFNPIGLTVIVALAPKTYAQQPGLLYESHDYAALGQSANAVLLMTYEWGYTYGPPLAVAPLPQVRQVLQYALTEIPADRIFLGIPTYGYDWLLPYQQGVSRATSLSPQRAIALARTYGAEIQYDETAQAPYFRYTAPDGREHEVWFEDARSAQAKLDLAVDNQLQGVGLWNLMRDFPQFYLVLNARYIIED